MADNQWMEIVMVSLAFIAICLIWIRSEIVKRRKNG